MISAVDLQTANILSNAAWTPCYTLRDAMMRTGERERWSRRPWKEAQGGTLLRSVSVAPSTAIANFRGEWLIRMRLLSDQSRSRSPTSASTFSGCLRSPCFAFVTHTSQYPQHRQQQHQTVRNDIVRVSEMRSSRSTRSCSRTSTRTGSTFRDPNTPAS